MVIIIKCFVSGSVDLSHDPIILGIGPDTGWGLEYRLEERL